MEYGLIGYPLKHSFSKEIHHKIKTFTEDYNYELVELEESMLDEFLTKKAFIAINVTIPYKQKVISYLDYIDDVAKEINAVNLIVNKDGKLYGYNTDYYGLNELLIGVDFTKFDTALILGTGGTSKTSKKVLTDKNVKNIIFVSRKQGEGVITYDELEKYYDKDIIIINSTPCGMYPNNDDYLIDVNKFTKLHAYIDCIYNPLSTKTVIDAKNKNIYATGGIKMLASQAIYAYEIFKNQKVDKKYIDIITKQIVFEKQNIVLIGMPSSGKSTISKILSKKLNKIYIDSDKEIEKKENMKISEIFDLYGENHFRQIEKEVIKDISKNSNIIIATGGGVILNKENIERLKQNGIIIFLNRKLEYLIPTNDRPLSSDINALKKRYDERIHLYLQYADIVIDANSSIKGNVEKILKALNVK